MSDRTKRCEERIEEELAKTERWCADGWQQLDQASERGDSTAEQAAVEELEPLSLEVKRVLKIMFSWGGPSDWIEAELYHDERGYSVAGVKYHFADWFDHAEREVTEAEAPALWRLAEYHAEYAELT